jgi:hypothetical protein
MNTVNKKIIVAGPRSIVLSIYLKNDGASGELVQEPLLTPSEVGLDSNARFRLQYVAYNFAGFDGVLEFDAGGVDPNFKWVLTEGANAPVDFRPFSHIRDDSGLDGTGILMLSTTGFSAADDQGSILLLVRKP